MFDHANAKRMNKHFRPTVNLEHAVYGYIPSSEMLSVKAQAHIQILLAQGAAGDFIDDDTALDLAGTAFTADRMIERGRDGFERRIGQTAFEEYRETKVSQNKGGWLRNPFRKKEQEQTTTSTGPQR